jgi:hypothetical protein
MRLPGTSLEVEFRSRQVQSSLAHSVGQDLYYVSFEDLDM